MSLDRAAATLPRMLDFTPNPVAFTIGPLAVGWYGIGYAVGLAAVYLLLYRLAKRAGEDQDILGNGIIIVAIAALIGGRAYHVIDQWDVLYKDDPVKIFLPPYSGLGVYGGIITGTIAAFIYLRYKKAPFMRWADIVAPGLFVMQAIARWGNFFNQELYGSPTTLPWGIPIECTHRIADFGCDRFPFETTRFQPLFLYESISGVDRGAGADLDGLPPAKAAPPRRPASDLLRLVRTDAVLPRDAAPRQLDVLRDPDRAGRLARIRDPAIVILMWRHRGRTIDDDPPTHPAVATWGAIGRPVDPDAVDDGFEDDEEGYDNLFPDEIDAMAAEAPDAPGDAAEASIDGAGSPTDRRLRPTTPPTSRSPSRPRADDRARAGARSGPPPATARPGLARGAGRRARRRDRGARLAGTAARGAAPRGPIACCAWSRGSSSSWSSGSGSRPPAGSTSRPPATSWSGPPTGAGWIRSWSCTPCRPSRGPGSSAAPRRPSRRAGVSG